MSSMGLRIYQKRKEYGYTMEELGNLLGVNKTAVNKWEKGIVENIKQSTIKKMADIFECSPTWLMGLDEMIEAAESTFPELNKERIELIEKYSKLSTSQQKIIMDTINAFLLD